MSGAGKTMQVQTNFLWLGKPVARGKQINGWREY